MYIIFVGVGRACVKSTIPQGTILHRHGDDFLLHSKLKLSDGCRRSGGRTSRTIRNSESSDGGTQTEVRR